jgi:hypothetical protein
MYSYFWNLSRNFEKLNIRNLHNFLIHKDRDDDRDMLENSLCILRKYVRKFETFINMLLIMIERKTDYLCLSLALNFPKVYVMKSFVCKFVMYAILGNLSLGVSFPYIYHMTIFVGQFVINAILGNLSENLENLQFLKLL